MGNFVVGVQGEISGAGLSGDATYLGSTYKTEANWLAAVTGRLGFTADHALIYAKGGAAFSDIDTTIDGVTHGDTRSGWTVGAGIEYAFAPNWSAFVEYDYYDFGKTTADFGGFDARTETTVNAVKLGVNYRFGGAAPVAARY